MPYPLVNWEHRQKAPAEHSVHWEPRCTTEGFTIFAGYVNTLQGLGAPLQNEAACRPGEFAPRLGTGKQHGFQPEADQQQSRYRRQQGSEGRAHQPRLQDCRSERSVPEGQGQEVSDRKHEGPLDGEQRFYWGGKGNTQPYTESYNLATGQWLRNL